MTMLDDRPKTKVCPRCNRNQHVSCFGSSKRKKDGLHVYCKKCSREQQAEVRERKRAAIEQRNRADRFIAGLVDSKELTIEELTGGFIYLDDGSKYSTLDFDRRTSSKFNSELSRRLNQMIRERSPRSIEIIFNIADSDLVEPADRLKAATWIAERVIGKTPEKLELSLESQPHENIFESISGGSRNEHRKALGNAIDAEVIEDGLDESENNISNQDGIIDGETISESEMVSGSNDKKVRLDDGQLDDSGSGNADTIETEIFQVHLGAETRADQIVAKRDEAKDLKKRIADAKKRRFAARASGATDLASAPWLIDWRVAQGQEEGLVAILVAPTEQTSRRLATIHANDSQTNDARFIAFQRANMALSQAQAAKRKLERLKQNG